MQVDTHSGPQDFESGAGGGRDLNEIRGDLEALWREWRRLQSTRSVNSGEEASAGD